MSVRLIITICVGMLSPVLWGCDGSTRSYMILGTAQPSCEIPDHSEVMIQEMVGLMNQERALLGMNPLKYNDELSAYAGAYACTMITEGFFGHDNPVTGQGFVERHYDSPFCQYPAGENLASGHQSAAEAMLDWMNSPSHSDNILNDQYVEVGVGLRQSSVDGRLYWVQLFIGSRIDGPTTCGDMQPPMPQAGADHALLTHMGAQPMLPSGHPGSSAIRYQIMPGSDDPTAGE